MKSQSSRQGGVLGTVYKILFFGFLNEIMLCLSKIVPVGGQNMWFVKKFRKLSLNFSCYPFLSGALVQEY